MRVERISGYKDSWSLFNIASVFEEFFAAAMKMEQNRKSVPLYHITELYIIFAPLYVCKCLSFLYRFLCLVTHYLQSVLLSTTHFSKKLVFYQVKSSYNLYLHCSFITAFEIFKVSNFNLKKNFILEKVGVTLH